jgi:4-amino-4-deoxy-L-arabinose transferase-like glycosyltransferase
MRVRREALGVGAMVLGVFALYAWSAGYWIDPIDEGYFLDMADRILRGELPYRDFTTYYTPGVFYLFALFFKLFGISILPIRLLMAGLRAVCALLLYGLTRRVAPWPFAVLPFAVVAALDHWPIEPEPHPSWPAIVLCLLTMEMVSRHLYSGRARWLALAGLTTGLAFLFKQNIGAFTAIGLAGYIVLRPQVAGRVLRATQVGFAVVVSVAITVLVRPDLDPLLAGALWLPPLLTLALLVRMALTARKDASWAAGLSQLIKESATAGAPFVAVTVLWLVPLAAAIGLSQVPIGLFLGSIDQTGIATPLADFTVGAPALLAIALWLPTALLLIDRRQQSRNLLVAAVVLTLLVFVLPLWHGPRDRLTEDAGFAPLLTALDVSYGTLHLYLPALAAWAALVALALKPVGLASWYLLFGVLAALTMYPRADTAHALVSGPPVFVAGAWALSQVYRTLCTTAAWRRLVVVLSLLLVPLAALAPQVMWRYAVFVAPEQDADRLDYTPLRLARAPVLVPSQWAEDMRSVVEYVRAGTPVGAPFFAYPVVPLFNFLADRPNPTRFDHFLPGTLTSGDMQEVIADLQRAQPRYVLWDHLGVVLWKTDPANRPLSDYMWRCYSEVAAFHLYLVLERRPGQC